ncbi:MAG: protein kinase [Alphaproteobacteria bacterium]|nr:protein kinase [Alphaproteobacteria bacterium]MCB9797520.1 protein kinase [Alphaproteobacteria bacterium]
MVFRAHNREAPGQTAAIKLLDPTRHDWRETRSRLLHDVEPLLLLEHPNLSKVRSVRISGHLPHVELALVQGQRLSIPREPLSPGRVAGWLTDIAEGLSAMHALGLRHRDIKLDNLILQEADQRVILVDLGTHLGARPRPNSGLPYLPPEADGDAPVDPVLWDLHAVGIVAWQLLSGKPAFKDAASQGFAEVCRLKRALGPLDPGEDLPVDMRALVRELTHPLPRKRIRTATQLLERLEEMNLERTDPRFTFDKGVSTWDPEEPKKLKRLSDAGNETWLPGEMAEPDGHAAPTMPPPEPSDPPPDTDPPTDTEPPTEELIRDPRQPSGEPVPTTPPLTTGAVAPPPDRMNQLLIGLIILLLVALAASLGVLLTR